MRNSPLAVLAGNITLLTLMATTTARDLGVMPGLAPLLQPPAHSSEYTSVPASRYRALRAEARDEPWATAMETRLRQYLQSIDTDAPREPAIEILLVTCRTTLCEVQAISRGGEMGEQFAFQEISSQMVREDFATDLTDVSVSMVLDGREIGYAVFFVRKTARVS